MAYFKKGMHTTAWKNKFQILPKLQGREALFSENSLGLFFECPSQQQLIVHFKPLNETFKEGVGGKGILIIFERSLIDENDIEYALDVMSLFNKQPKLELTKEADVKTVQTLVQLLEYEFYGDATSYIMLKSMLKVLLLHLIRYQNHRFLEQDLNQKRVFQFLELMETHFLEATDAEFYAEQIGISTKRLNQILKAKLKATAKQIIRQRQLTEAQRILVRGDITIKELAYKLGFDSISSFSRVFKKHFGVSPSEFRDGR